MNKNQMIKEGHQFALKIKDTPIVIQIVDTLKTILDKKIKEASDNGYTFVQTFHFNAWSHSLAASNITFNYTEYGYKPLFEPHQVSGLKIAIINMLMQYLQQHAFVKRDINWDVDPDNGQSYIQFYVKPNSYDHLKDW